MIGLGWVGLGWLFAAPGTRKPQHGKTFITKAEKCTELHGDAVWDQRVRREGLRAHILLAADRRRAFGAFLDDTLDVVEDLRVVVGWFVFAFDAQLGLVWVWFGLF